MMRKTGKKEDLERWLRKDVVLVSLLRGNVKPEIYVGVLQRGCISGLHGYYIEDESKREIQISRKNIMQLKRTGDVRVIVMDYQKEGNQIEGVIK